MDIDALERTPARHEGVAPRNGGAPLVRVARAAVLAGVLSGAPSTLHALRRDRSGVLDATFSAGAIVAGEDASRAVRLAVAVPVHAAMSLGWTVVLDRVLPARRGALWGALAGLAIAALDLGVIGRRIAPITALPLGPQVADHILFGAVAGGVLRRERVPIGRGG
ncbi:MAG: hypothetical protein JWP17_2660 [Solirubrobacterales bacterium]|nr:hypothetical protein [Solirubrobacterales bacterium]